MGRVVYGSRVSIFKGLFEAKKKLNTAFLLLGINPILLISSYRAIMKLRIYKESCAHPPLN